MFPFAWLTGLNVQDSFQFAQYMGMKLVTNEFVVMGKVTGTISTHTHLTSLSSNVNSIFNILC